MMRLCTARSDPSRADDSGFRGRVLVRAATDGESAIRVDIIDNGKGLPAENRHRLLEPYMTTREKGTGLGLAIVQKIIEDHGGRLELNDAPEDFDNGRGAMITIVLPAQPQQAALGGTLENGER